MWVRQDLFSCDAKKRSATAEGPTDSDLPPPVFGGMQQQVDLPDALPFLRQTIQSRLLALKKAGTAGVGASETLPSSHECSSDNRGLSLLIGALFFALAFFRHVDIGHGRSRGAATAAVNPGVDNVAHVNAPPTEPPNRGGVSPAAPDADDGAAVCALVRVAWAAKRRGRRRRTVRCRGLLGHQIAMTPRPSCSGAHGLGCPCRCRQTPSFPSPPAMAWND